MLFIDLIITLNIRRLALPIIISLIITRILNLHVPSTTTTTTTRHHIQATLTV
jgi:hypothetical protein